MLLLGFDVCFDIMYSGFWFIIRWGNVGEGFVYFVKEILGVCLFFMVVGVWGYGDRGVGRRCV